MQPRWFHFYPGPSPVLLRLPTWRTRQWSNPRPTVSRGISSCWSWHYSPSSSSTWLSFYGTKLNFLAALEVSWQNHFGISGVNFPRRCKWLLCRVSWRWMWQWRCYDWSDNLCIISCELNLMVYSDCPRRYATPLSLSLCNPRRSFMQIVYKI